MYCRRGKDNANGLCSCQCASVQNGNPIYYPQTEEYAVRCRCPECGQACRCVHKGEDKMKVVTIVSLLFLCLLSGCLSASSSTGAESSASIKAKQSTSQETTSIDSVKLSVESTTITQTLQDGTMLVITAGGGKAETGSKTEQQSEMMNKTSANAQAAADSSAKAVMNLTYVLIGIVGLILISGGSRLLAFFRKWI